MTSDALAPPFMQGCCPKRKKGEETLESRAYRDGSASSRIRTGACGEDVVGEQSGGVPRREVGRELLRQMPQLAVPPPSPPVAPQTEDAALKRHATLWALVCLDGATDRPLEVTMPFPTPNAADHFAEESGIADSAIVPIRFAYVPPARRAGP